jgi:regulation of enolase protein 1 (concanavalin A-like superfamily)
MRRSSRRKYRVLIALCAVTFSASTLSAQSLPTGWSNADVGAVQAAGSASFDGSTFSVTGSGADIWGTFDEFHWAFRTMSGDFSIQARVDSVENIHRWTKAGLMVRVGTATGAVHSSFFATPTTEKGIAFQHRDNANGQTLNASGPAFAPPVWLRLVRRSNSIAAYYRKNRTDGWTFFQYIVPPGLPAAGSLRVGLAVSSHVDGLRATARFSEVIVENLPPWSFTQIGASGSQGSWDFTLFSLGGRGADIWNKVDAFAGMFVPWSGNGVLTVRVRELQNTHRSAKAGVMFRETLTRSSRHVMNIVTAERGIAVQYRPETGENTLTSPFVSGAAPVWLRLRRNGDVFTGQASSDYVNWRTVFTVTQPLNPSLYVGFVHTSHDPSVAGFSLFDDVLLQR